MSLKEQISADLKQAMKDRDQVRIDTLRSILSAFTYKRVETGKEDLTADEELAVVAKQVKQRTDAIAEFSKAQRADLLEKEKKEKDILVKYLPAQKSDAEIREIVRGIISTIPQGERNKGNAMKLIMPQLKGLAEGNLVKQIVTEELS